MSAEYSDRFLRLDAITVGLEGGPANQPADRGGQTAAGGISRRSYPDEDPWPPSLERGQYLRHRDYWGRCDELPELVAIAVYDWAIHAGTDRPARELQQQLGVRVDGDIGPRTVEACLARCGNLEQELDLAYALLRARARHLSDLVREDASQLDFLTGWWYRTLAIGDSIHRAYLRAFDSRPLLAGEGGEMTAPVTGGEARPASTPLQGVVRQVVRFPVALVIGWLSTKVPGIVPPESAPGVTETVTLSVAGAVMAGLAGLGKLARDRGWPVLGSVL